MNKKLSPLFLKKYILFITIALIAGLVFLSALPNNKTQFQDVEDWGCTSIMVGRLASTDGSIITCHSCDGNYRTWVKMEPHQKHGKNAVNKIFHGKLHTETPWDMRYVTEAGEIPQVEETYAFLNTAYPCMNEKQLAIGETTIGGKRELRNSEGLFLIEELERILLERCTSAREAIKLAGELVKEYGYCDAGECITIADPKEVWHFEIFGAGPLEIGAVWAAVRIPDDHVGISANIPRIGKLDLDDPDFYMASENVYSVAEEMGWWDPDSGEPFIFWKAYSGRKPFSTREYFVLSTLAPSLNLSMEAEELPFSVKPEKKLSVRDVFAFYRQTYAGTDLDMTKDLMVQRFRRGGSDSDEKIKSPVVHPFMSYDMINLINTLKPEAIERYRTIAISGCSYSHVTQLRSWLPDEIGGICWFSFDNPAQSPRIPIFAGVKELLPGFEICGQKQYRTDSACWYFRRANRLSTVRYGIAGPIIDEAVQEFEDKVFTELPDVEKKVLEMIKAGETEQAKIYLTQYYKNFARASMQKYWELGDHFWGLFARGF